MWWNASCTNTPHCKPLLIIQISLDRGRPHLGTEGNDRTLDRPPACGHSTPNRTLAQRSPASSPPLGGSDLAVCDIDEVIRIIRASRTREDAIAGLMGATVCHRHRASARKHHPADLLQASREASGLALSRLQAEAIGALRLIQLVGLEIEKLVADYAELLSKIQTTKPSWPMTSCPEHHPRRLHRPAGEIRHATPHHL